MTVKELKIELDKYDDEMIVSIHNSMDGFYEPINKTMINEVRKHDDVYSEKSGARFIDTYKKKFIKGKINKIVSLYN